MIKIYCLINPYTNRPFYVGATKLDLNKRLSSHISKSISILPHYRNRKHYLINYLYSNKTKPLIIKLHECSLHAADHYEEFFYTSFINQGFILLQQIKFSYTARYQPGKLINQRCKLKNTNTQIVKIN